MAVKYRITLALLVLLASLVAVLTWGQVKQPPAPSSPWTKYSAPPATNSPVGRYQIFSNPNVRADMFLVDTQTGATWQRITITDVVDTPTIWKYQTRIDSDLEFSKWAVQQTFKSQEGAK